MIRYDVQPQGGDPAEDALPVADLVHVVSAPHSGYVADLGAIAIGLAALRLGAGRNTKEDPIDHAVGIRCLRKRGDAVDEGTPLAEVHARDKAAATSAAQAVAAAYRIDDEPPRVRPLLIDVLSG